jgi:hypothetical protein
MKSRSQDIVTGLVTDGKTSSQRSYASHLGTNILKHQAFMVFKLPVAGIKEFYCTSLAIKYSKCQAVYVCSPLCPQHKMGKREEGSRRVTFLYKH